MNQQELRKAQKFAEDIAKKANSYKLQSKNAEVVLQYK